MSSDNQSFTILGAAGFIGGALVAWLESHGHVVHAVTRASLPALLASQRPAGHVIDCIGLTGDFRTRPMDTAEAHVGLVARCLTDLRFTSFLLLSSTRVYARATETHEDAVLPTLPSEATDLYNVTKLAGESLCLADARFPIRVARLSNVYGIGMPDETFLGQVLHEGHHTGGVIFRESPASAKDYIGLAALVRLLPMISTRGAQRIYNVAAGGNISHATIAYCLREIAGWHTSFAPDGPTVRHPQIDIARLEAEFGPVGCSLLDELPVLLALEQESQCSPSMKHMVA